MPAACAVMLGGCGQRGPLYLPTQPQAQERATLPELLTPGMGSSDSDRGSTAPQP